ncbi:hypothetical protein [Longimicrobium sp.]|uniref:hypothetical protein n=1 Tax=Longimicrobium sp. TaxID=2029185 RepID=UPI003B3B7264
MTDYPRQVTLPSSHTPAMFRITRGHHVQHVHFPLPIIRDLDALDEEPPRKDAPDAAPSAAIQDEAVKADATADATR